MTARPAGEEVDVEVAQRRLHGLVERLRGDGADGGFDYEQLRRRLVLFFARHEPVEAEALADEALDRLARRLDEGAAIERIASYSFGIAKLMLLEARQRRWRHDVVMQEMPAHAATDEDDEIDPALLAALRACLRQAGADDAELMLTYYRDEDARRIVTRRNLATRLGISLNALRNRALRLRNAIEACVARRTGMRTRMRRDGIAQADTLGDD
jgi:DNA-directed RNA polymerase specialized sigma24 family protein